MSEVEYQQNVGDLSQAEKIASQTSAKQYFLNEQTNIMDQWGQKSTNLFKFTAEVFMIEYQIKSSQLVQKYGQKYEDLYSKSRKQFEAYCILNLKVQKKNQTKRLRRQIFKKLAEIIKTSSYKLINIQFLLFQQFIP